MALFIQPNIFNTDFFNERQFSERQSFALSDYGETKVFDSGEL
jgi:hypothetical protein